MLKLEVVMEGHAPHVVALGDSPLLIGRAPSNDLVVPDDQISWHHAAIWVEGGRPWVRDMGSKNGTFFNGQRLRGAEALAIGDRVALGTHTEIRVSTGGEVASYRPLLLEDLGSGVRIPLRSDRLHIGSGEDADLRIDGAPARAATLLVEEDGAVVLGTDDSTFPLRPDQEFEVAGRVLRLIEMPATQAPTVEPDTDRYPYRLTATLNGGTGPEAKMEDPGTGLSYTVAAENRAILLYLLARQVIADLQARKPHTDAGWMGDDEVSVGVWGRGGPGDANSLHVLVYRLRKELQKAGFDPWFIEKRRRALRIRLRDVVVD